jgi:hypothetical protein
MKPTTRHRSGWERYVDPHPIGIGTTNLDAPLSDLIHFGAEDPPQTIGVFASPGSDC